MKNHYNYNTGDCLSVHLSDCCVLCPTYTLQSLTGEDTRTAWRPLNQSVLWRPLSWWHKLHLQLGMCSHGLWPLPQCQLHTYHPSAESSQHQPGSVWCPPLLIGWYWNDTRTQYCLTRNYNTFDRKSIFRTLLSYTELHCQCLSVSFNQLPSHSQGWTSRIKNSDSKFYEVICNLFIALKGHLLHFST